MPKGGYRPGAGKKKGSHHAKTIETRIALEEMRQRILKDLDPIISAQLQLAKGISYLYKIVEDEDDNKKRKHILVENPKEIESVMNKTNGEGGNCDGDFYYITTKAPENKAIDSLIDRVFGKAKQSVEISNEDDKPFKVVHLIEDELKNWAKK